MDEYVDKNLKSILTKISKRYPKQFFEISKFQKQISFQFHINQSNISAINLS